MLAKKFGYFDITSNMINACKGGTLILWINENIFENNRQYPIFVDGPQFCEDLMIRRLLARISGKCQHQVLSEIMEKKILLSFELVKGALRSHIKSEKKGLYYFTNVTEKKKRKIPTFIVSMREKRKEKIH